MKEKTNAKGVGACECGSVIQSEQKAGYRHRDDGGVDRYREMTEKEVETQHRLGCEGKPSSFFLLGLSSVGARFVYFVELIGVREGD